MWWSSPRGVANGCRSLGLPSPSPGSLFPARTIRRRGRRREIMNTAIPPEWNRTSLYIRGREKLSKAAGSSRGRSPDAGKEPGPDGPGVFGVPEKVPFQHAVFEERPADEEDGGQRLRDERPVGPEDDRRGQAEEQAAEIAGMPAEPVGPFAADRLTPIGLDANDAREVPVDLLGPEKEPLTGDVKDQARGVEGQGRFRAPMKPSGVD